MSRIQRLSSVSHNCKDAARSSDWYRKTLGFKILNEDIYDGDWLATLLGLTEAVIKRKRLQLGDEILELWQWLEGENADEALPETLSTCPAGNDAAFQHICLVTTDLGQAFSMGAEQAAQISSAPQRLPDWNPGAGGICAVKFQDPDGHPLELLEFPAGKGDSRWQKANNDSNNLAKGLEKQSKDLFLGLDHTAISILETERSLQFYTNILGMELAGQGHNFGPEQDAMDGLNGTDVLISSLHAAGQGMGIELLNYLQPQSGQRSRQNPQSNDWLEWRICAVVDDLIELYPQLQAQPLATNLGPLVAVPAGFGPGSLACQVRDPDGHALLLFTDKTS